MPSALDALRRNRSVHVWTYLSRHVTGDWGDAGHRRKSVQIADDCTGAHIKDHELPGAHV